MSFEGIETSRHGGALAELYLFKYGPGTADYFAYTDALKPIIFDAQNGLGDLNYEPIAIDRDSSKSTGNLDKATMNVRVPRNIGMATLFQNYPPSNVIFLTVYAGHLTDVDGEFRCVFAGRVVSQGREGSEYVFGCQPSSTSMKRPGLRWHYQIGCPHVLFDPETCRAVEADFTVQAEVDTIDGLSVTLVDGWEAQPIEKYRQGTFKWTNDLGMTEIRQILAVVAPNTLKLNGLLRGLIEGATVDVALGCNHKHGTGGDCVEIFDNGPNYGGCKWIPTKNPIGLNNQYY